MSKYSNEFKLKVVKYCIEGEHGYESAAKHFGIPSKESVRIWIKRYKLYGPEGILKNLNSSYSSKFKENVIEYMHANHLSASQTAIIFRIGDASRILKWERIYYEKGPTVLDEEQCGKKRNMNSKPRKKKLPKEVEKDLIAENQRLKMENEYLKKLNALVQERIKRESKKK